jgi:hypothetical protein
MGPDAFGCVTLLSGRTRIYASGATSQGLDGVGWRKMNMPAEQLKHRLPLMGLGRSAPVSVIAGTVAIDTSVRQYLVYYLRAWQSVAGYR